MTIKTVADFKRAMVPGTAWKATHRYLGNQPTEPKSLGTRECVLNNSVDFGFKNPKTGETSHCSWPKKAEFSTEEEGKVVVITKKDFCELRYEKV